MIPVAILLIPIEIVMMLVLFPMALIEMAIMALAFPLAIILMTCLEVIMGEGEIGFIKAFMEVWSLFWDVFRDIVNPDNVYPQNFLMLHSIGINR